MSEKILFVDDEVNVLNGLKRQLRHRFSLQTAGSGDDALQCMKEHGPFTVIVSDMRMPGMSGAKLLSEVKNRYPDTVRIMLTGNADQETAIKAVNEGQIFRFLTKPCPSPTLVLTLALAQRQYRLITAERELLNKTLKGSIKVLTELLSLANATAFSASSRIKNIVVQMAEKLNMAQLWQYEIAALMSQIGCATLPGDILNKRYDGVDLSEEELEMFENHPLVGAELVKNIPRLETVASMIKDQQRCWNTYDQDSETQGLEEYHTGAQILKVALDYDMLTYHRMARDEALKSMKKQHGHYNPQLLNMLGDLRIEEGPTHVVSLPVEKITIGMVVDQDVIAKNGTLLIPKGQEVTRPVIHGLVNFAKKVGIVGPIRVQLEPDEEQIQEV